MAVLFVLSSLVSFAGAAAHELPQQRPHVLLILADDYGWANFGVHRRGPARSADMRQGQLEVHTPHLDALADEGILLERHYAYKLCAPSRSALQSGRLAVHVNSRNIGVTSRNASDPVSGWAGIPRNMTGLAQKMHSAGYRTHMVGKWDAGMATPEHTPQGRGYETWIGYFQHANDYWRKNSVFQATGEVDVCLNNFADFFMHNATYRGGVRDTMSTSQECLADPASHPACYEEHTFKERALSVIRSHDTFITDAPLFLFYAFHLLHSPLQVPEAYLRRIDHMLAESGADSIDTEGRRLYAAMTLYMDEAVGDVVQALKSKGMWDNTLIIFLADNGGPLYVPGSGNNFPLKGGKYSDWEGGIRTNAFLSGGFLPATNRGTTFSGVVSIADWYGTLCELAGADPIDRAAERANTWVKEHGLPPLHPVDSVAQWRFILNGTNGRPTALHISENAVLRWPYKLVTGKQPYSNWTGPLFPNCTSLNEAAADNGPLYPDIKLFNHRVPLADEVLEDHITWVQDCGSGCLLDVSTDPEERHDLADDPAHADILRELQNELKQLNKQVFQPGRGAQVFEACEAAIDNGGFYGPFVDTAGWYSPVVKSPGQQLKDEALKDMLWAASSQIFQQTTISAARAIFPSIRVPWTRRLDKCLKSERSSFEGFPVMMV